MTTNNVTIIGVLYDIELNNYYIILKSNDIIFIESPYIVKTRLKVLCGSNCKTNNFRIIDGRILIENKDIDCVEFKRTDELGWETYEAKQIQAKSIYIFDDELEDKDAYITAYLNREYDKGVLEGYDYIANSEEEAEEIIREDLERVKFKNTKLLSKLERNRAELLMRILQKDLMKVPLYVVRYIQYIGNEGVTFYKVGVKRNKCEFEFKKIDNKTIEKI